MLYGPVGPTEVIVHDSLLSGNKKFMHPKVLSPLSGVEKEGWR